MQFKLSYLKSNLNSLEKSLKHKLNWVNVLLWSEIHNSQYDQILSNRLNTILGDRHGRYKEEDGEAVEWDIRGRGIKKQAEEIFVQESFFWRNICSRILFSRSGSPTSRTSKQPTRPRRRSLKSSWGTSRRRCRSSPTSLAAWSIDRRHQCQYLAT